jgi:hypothetical protein
MLGSRWGLDGNVRSQGRTLRQEAISYIFSTLQDFKTPLPYKLSFKTTLAQAMKPRMNFKAVTTEHKAFLIFYMGCYICYIGGIIQCHRLSSENAKHITLYICSTDPA